MTQKELQAIFEKHAKWLNDEVDGERADLQGADLQGANLRDANLRSANLQSANLRGANLQGANLQGANLQGAYLRGANLLNADLQGANLRFADLRNANLLNADLQGANLRFANLRCADLQCADLQGANLLNADLQGVDQRFANLRCADLQCADLQGANLLNADLQGVDQRYLFRVNTSHIPPNTSDEITTNEAGGKQSKVEYAFHLIPYEALLEVAKCVKIGHKKYGLVDGAQNWKKIPIEEHINHCVGHAYKGLNKDATEDHFVNCAVRALFALQMHIESKRELVECGHCPTQTKKGNPGLPCTHRE